MNHNPEIVRCRCRFELGGSIVFAADGAGLEWLSERLPKDDRFPDATDAPCGFPQRAARSYRADGARGQSAGGFRRRATLPLSTGRAGYGRQRRSIRCAIYDYTLGAISSTGPMISPAQMQVAAAEFAPDKTIVLGPGTTLGAPTAQALIGTWLARAFGQGGFSGATNNRPGHSLDGNSRNSGRLLPVEAVHTNVR